MARKANLASENGRSKFEIYSGRNVDQMPKLVADDRVPMNTAQLMQRRLELQGDATGVKDFYRNNYFDTGDGVVYHPDGQIKVVLDSEHLRSMTPDSSRNAGALILGADVYNALEGEEFKKGKTGKTGAHLSKEEIKNHPIWRALARDQGLLNEYADYVTKDGGFDKAMAVYLGSAVGTTPEMRAWCVGRVGVGSVAGGDDGLGVDGGRLVGLASETLSAPGSVVKAYDLRDLKAVDEALEGLESTVRPEVLEPILKLRRKLK